MGKLLVIAGHAISAAILASTSLGCCPHESHPTSVYKPSISTTLPSLAVGSRQDPLRSKITDAWAKHILGNVYTSFKACNPAEKRKEIFADVFRHVDLASRAERVSGNQCLDLLGPPNRWEDFGPGVLLVYFYSAGGRSWSAVIITDGSGYVLSCGYTVDDREQYNAPAFRRESP